MVHGGPQHEAPMRQMRRANSRRVEAANYENLFREWWASGQTGIVHGVLREAGKRVHRPARGGTERNSRTHGDA